jgi:peptidoglycan/LPS O-acetylase OafA/YrhL
METGAILSPVASQWPDLISTRARDQVKLAANRVIGLDILRFIAVTLVVFRHLAVFKGSPGWLGRISLHLNEGGWIGVDIFFVLSGFLVSGLLFREWQQHKTVSVGRFLWRRGWKIYPSFWFFLMGMIVIYFCRGQQANWRRMLVELLFLQNYGVGAFDHTWSLAVEEHFYFMLALGSWILFRRQRLTGANPYRFIPIIFLIVAALCLAARLVSNQIFPLSQVRSLFFCTHIRVDSLLFGVMLSYFWHFTFTAKHHDFFHRWRYVMLLAGGGLLAPMFFVEPLGVNGMWVRVYGFVLCYLAGGMWLIAFMNIFQRTQSTSARFLGFLGANSYSVYLWHEMGIFIGGCLISAHSKNAVGWVGYGLISLVAVWVIGLVAAQIIENPVLKLRDYWFPSLTSKQLKV